MTSNNANNNNNNNNKPPNDNRSDSYEDKLSQHQSSSLDKLMASSLMSASILCDEKVSYV